MVKIAVAGGSGRIATEVVNALVSTKKHEILILSRKEQATTDHASGITWAKTDYSDKTQLTFILEGFHTVLSFIGGPDDPGSAKEKNLIDAAVAAGVKRYAPNEWSSATIEELPWYAEKAVIREYIAELNKEKKVIEYTLFQPGLLADFLAPPGTTSLSSSQELFIDFDKRRAITLEGKDGVYTLTTMDDLANVVARAVEYKGEWPVVGGVKGTTITSSEILELGAKIHHGNPLEITTLKEEDVRADNIKSPWIPKFEHPALTPEQNEHFSKLILKGSLLSGLSHSWVVSDEWNRLLPEYEFTNAGKFLEEKWAGKA